MTNPFRESLQEGVLYPDDLEQYGPVEYVDGPIEAEDVEHEDARYGKWIKVDNGDGEAWATAPEGLRAFLADAVDAHGLEQLVFEVNAMTEGREEHDPYTVEARVTHVDGEEIEEDTRVYRGKTEVTDLDGY